METEEQRKARKIVDLMRRTIPELFGHYPPEIAMNKFAEKHRKEVEDIIAEGEVDDGAGLH